MFNVSISTGSTIAFAGATHGQRQRRILRRQPRLDVDQQTARQSPGAAGAPELALSEIAIKDLPLYSSDFDAGYPPVARTLKQAIAEVDAVLFVTPEHNRSIPGGLKNAID